MALGSGWEHSRLCSPYSPGTFILTPQVSSLPRIVISTRPCLSSFCCWLWLATSAALLSTESRTGGGSVPSTWPQPSAGAPRRASTSPAARASPQHPPEPRAGVRGCWRDRQGTRSLQSAGRRGGAAGSPNSPVTSSAPQRSAGLHGELPYPPVPGCPAGRNALAAPRGSGRSVRGAAAKRCRPLVPEQDFPGVE